MEINQISCAAELKLAIETKQFQHAIAIQVLRDECLNLYKGLNPLTQIKNMLTSNGCSPYLMENVFQEIRDVVINHFLKTTESAIEKPLLTKVLESLKRFIPAMILHQKSALIASLGAIIMKLIVRKSDTKTPNSD